MYYILTTLQIVSCLSNDWFHAFKKDTLLGTHMVVLGGLEQYPEQPVGSRAAAQRQHCLIQVLLGLQGQQQLNTQGKKCST